MLGLALSLAAVAGLQWPTRGMAQAVGAPQGVVPPRAAPPKPTGLSQLSETESAQPTRAAAAVAVKTEEGDLGGSDFRIDVPSGENASGTGARWNRQLVLYYHGYQPEPEVFRPNPATNAPYPPTRLVTQLLQRGYAVAQPGYRSGGWAIATAPGDADALRHYFSKRNGSPQRTFIVGQSMGGLLTVLSLEQNPHDYAGGLAICGVLAPADAIMQRAFANRVAFDAFFPGILPDVEHIPAGFHMNDPATASVVEKALDAHAAEAALLRSLADIHTNRGLADVLVFNTFVIQDLRNKAGGNPFDNRNLIYTGTTDDNALNARVRRYAADARALHYVAEYGSPSGNLRRPLLALHTTYDPLVPASTAGYYDELTRRLGVGDRFVQQYVDRDGHCNVTPEQVGAAFDELVSWSDGGARPEPGRLPDAAGQKPVHQEPNAVPTQPKTVGKPQ
ncbi:alpha/beta fold hydrolase [Acidipila sp. EB88]|nr:alpha/beta fold hydrolase [Acidipila sp. EB88]